MENKIKIYLNKAGESWVADRFRDEWYQNSKFKTKFLRNSDIVWIISPWTWQKLDTSLLKTKKVVCTIHHLDIDKFNDKELKQFYSRDKFVDVYHVPSESTQNQLINYTEKKIYTIPFWIDQEKYFSIDNKNSIKKKYGIPEKSFVVGSFQRDTEGSDLKSPKLSKGPDKLVKYFTLYKKREEKLFILLSGYRRQFIINELKKIDVQYKYIERPSIKVLNELYNSLDLYIVGSRVEGGPQSIMECALIKVPIISTDVGIASQILNKSSIFDEKILDAKPDINHAYKMAKEFTLPNGIKKFEKMFEEIHEN